MIVGFIGKTSDPDLMRILLEKTKLVSQVTENIKSYHKNPHESVQPFMTEGSLGLPIEALEMKNYLNNVLNMSHYIYNWSKGSLKKEI